MQKVSGSLTGEIRELSGDPQRILQERLNKVLKNHAGSSKVKSCAPKPTVHCEFPSHGFNVAALR